MHSDEVMETLSILQKFGNCIAIRAILGGICCSGLFCGAIIAFSTLG